MRGRTAGCSDSVIFIRFDAWARVALALFALVYKRCVEIQGCSNCRSLPALILLLKVAPRVLVRCSMSFSVKGVRKQFLI